MLLQLAARKKMKKRRQSVKKKATKTLKIGSSRAAPVDSIACIRDTEQSDCNTTFRSETSSFIKVSKKPENHITIELETKKPVYVGGL